MAIPWKDIPDLWKKIPILLLLALIMIGTALLFLPVDILERLSLIKLRDSYGKWIGLVLLISTVLFLLRILQHLWDSIAIRYQRNIFGRSIVKELSELTPEEKAYLIPFIRDGATAIYEEMSNGVICSLEEKGILHQASPVGDSLYDFAYLLHPVARKELKKRPDLLKGALGKRPRTISKKHQNEARRTGLRG